MAVNHQGHVELVQPLAQDGHAQQAPGLGDHKVDGVGSDGFGSHNEVALVLSLLVVYDYEELALTYVIQGLFNAGQSHYTLAPGDLGWINGLRS